MRALTLRRFALRACTKAFHGTLYANRRNGFVLKTSPIAFGLLLSSVPHTLDFCNNRRKDQSDFHTELKAPAYSRFSGVSSLNDVVEVIKDTYSDIHDKVDELIRKKLSSQGGRDVLFITAVNVAVYAVWKIAPANFMHRHFTSSLEGMRRARVWTCVTSNFSHRGIFHLGANMYVLNKFGQDVAEVLGSHRFYLFYGTAGVASSLASLSFRRLTRNHYLSLGASGAVAATLWLYANLFPHRRLSFLGSEQTVSTQEFALAFTVLDVAGLLGSAGKIDFAAHVGGALFANAWFQLVRDKLVQEHKQRDARKRWTLSRFLSRTFAGVNRKESP